MYPTTQDLESELLCLKSTYIIEGGLEVDLRWQGRIRPLKLSNGGLDIAQLLQGEASLQEIGSYGRVKCAKCGDHISTLRIRIQQVFKHSLKRQPVLLFTVCPKRRRDVLQEIRALFGSKNGLLPSLSMGELEWMEGERIVWASRKKHLPHEHTEGIIVGSAESGFGYGILCLRRLERVSATNPNGGSILDSAQKSGEAKVGQLGRHTCVIYREEKHIGAFDVPVNDPRLMKSIYATRDILAKVFLPFKVDWAMRTQKVVQVAEFRILKNEYWSKGISIELEQQTQEIDYVRAKSHGRMSEDEDFLDQGFDSLGGTVFARELPICDSIACNFEDNNVSRDFPVWRAVESSL